MGMAGPLVKGKSRRRATPIAPPRARATGPVPPRQARRRSLGSQASRSVWPNRLKASTARLVVSDQRTTMSQQEGVSWPSASERLRPDRLRWPGSGCLHLGDPRDRATSPGTGAGGRRRTPPLSGAAALRDRRRAQGLWVSRRGHEPRAQPPAHGQTPGPTPARRNASTTAPGDCGSLLTSSSPRSRSSGSTPHPGVPGSATTPSSIATFALLSNRNHRSGSLTKTRGATRPSGRGPRP
jgi:hypothetical protein